MLLNIFHKYSVNLHITYLHDAYFHSYPTDPHGKIQHTLLFMRKEIIYHMPSFKDLEYWDKNTVT